ncbi:MAG: CpsD/CapB family tyrosine-protein kinase [Terracidiphilus sp.]|jgi:capsular exopolysaccharide synthesis family protein
MSRIFDALQRAERERNGVDSSLPEGAEFIDRAARRVPSQPAETGLEQEPATIKSAVRNSISGAGGAFNDLPASLEAPDLAELSAQERRNFLVRLKTLPISLPPQSRLVCLTDRESPTAEALRLLAVRLKDYRRIRPLKKVLITSTIPQEGKSTIAGNLACALSHATNERTLLIEGDLRRPSLSRMFGIHSSSGVCECLQDETAILRGIYHLQEAGLWILPAGRAPGNPLEALQSTALPVLLDHLASYFDWIIIDSPPVLPLADTSIWMRLSDGILLVTRQGTTEKRQLKKGLEALDGEKVLGAIVNGAIPSAYSGYYYRASSQTE